MSEVNQLLPNLAGGVSQQIPAERLPNTFASQVNGWGSLIHGLEKRSGSKFIAKAGYLDEWSRSSGYPYPFPDKEAPCEAGYFHLINRDRDERYLSVIMPPGPITIGDFLENTTRIWDTDGDEYEVLDLTDSQADYLNPRGPQEFTTNIAESIFTTASFWLKTLGGDDSTYSGLQGPFGFGQFTKMVSLGTGGHAQANYNRIISTPPGGVNRPCFSYYFRMIPGDTRPTSIGARIEQAGSTTIYEVDYDLATEVIDDTIEAGTGDVEVEDIGDGIFRLKVMPDSTGVVNRCIITTRYPTDTVTGVGIWGCHLTVDAQVWADFPPYVLWDFKTTIKATTVKDTTYIWNTEMDTRMTGTTTDLSAGNADMALVWVRRGGYEQEYTVWVSTSVTGLQFFTVSTQTAPAAGVGSGNETTQIAADMAAGLNALSGISATADGSVIKLEGDASGGGGTQTIVSISTADSWADEGLVVIDHKIDNPSNLPVTCYGGYKVLVTGDEESLADNYWVIFNCNEGLNAMGTGYWEESVEAGLEDAIYTGTMPMTLTRKQDDVVGTVTGTPNAVYFEFGWATWGDLLVGTADDNPTPSFIGSPISEVHFHEGRLILLSGQNVLLSRTNDLYDFWRSTTLVIPDSDRIDAEVQYPKAIDLLWAQPVDGRVILGGSTTQFVMRAEGPLTPTSIEVQPLFETDLWPAEPGVLGTSLFCAGPAGTYSRIFEIFPLDARIRYDKRDTTQAVPEYIEGEVIRISVTNSDNAIFVTTDTGGLYVFRIENRPQGQAPVGGWGKWEVGDGVLACEALEDKAYMFVQREDSTLIEEVTIPPRKEHTFLDAYFTPTMVYTPAGDFTTFTSPYDIESGVPYRVLVNGVEVPNDEDTVHGDVTGETVIVGAGYDWEVELSRPAIRRSGSTGGLSSHTIDENVLIQCLNLEVGDTQEFVIQSVVGEHTYETQFLLPGIGILVTGTPIPTDARITHPIGSFALDSTITLKSSHPAYVGIQAIEWQLLQNTRRKSYPL